MSANNAESSDNTLVLFDSYYTLADAYIAKGVLETNGIPAQISNETFSSVYPLTVTPIGAIQLWVRQCDVEAAMQIINQSEISEI